MILHTYRTTVANISRAKLGRIIGCDGVTIYRWETGRSVPSQYTIERIAEWSNGQVTAADFVRGE